MKRGELLEEIFQNYPACAEGAIFIGLERGV